MQLHHIHPLHSMRTTPKNVAEGTTPFWRHLLHFQLLLRHFCLSCQRSMAKICDKLRGGNDCRAFRRAAVGIAREIYSSSLQKGWRTSKTRINVWNLQHSLLPVKCISWTPHHFCSRILQPRDILLHHQRIWNTLNYLLRSVCSAY